MARSDRGFSCSERTAHVGLAFIRFVHCSECCALVYWGSKYRFL